LQQIHHLFNISLFFMFMSTFCLIGVVTMLRVFIFYMLCIMHTHFLPFTYNWERWSGTDFREVRITGSLSILTCCLYHCSYKNVVSEAILIMFWADFEQMMDENGGFMLILNWIHLFFYCSYFCAMEYDFCTAVCKSCYKHCAT
jgi:hypothetical protein